MGTLLRWLIAIFKLLRRSKTQQITNVYNVFGDMHLHGDHIGDQVLKVERQRRKRS